MPAHVGHPQVGDRPGGTSRSGARSGPTGRRRPSRPRTRPSPGTRGGVRGSCVVVHHQDAAFHRTGRPPAKSGRSAVGPVHGRGPGSGRGDRSSPGPPLVGSSRSFESFGLSGYGSVLCFVLLGPTRKRLPLPGGLLAVRASGFSASFSRTITRNSRPSARGPPGGATPSSGPAALDRRAGFVQSLDSRLVDVDDDHPDLHAAPVGRAVAVDANDDQAAVLVARATGAGRARGRGLSDNPRSSKCSVAAGRLAGVGSRSGARSGPGGGPVRAPSCGSTGRPNRSGWDSGVTSRLRPSPPGRRRATTARRRRRTRWRAEGTVALDRAGPGGSRSRHPASTRPCRRGSPRKRR